MYHYINILLWRQHCHIIQLKIKKTMQKCITVSNGNNTIQQYLPWMWRQLCPVKHCYSFTKVRNIIQANSNGHGHCCEILISHRITDFLFYVQHSGMGKWYLFMFGWLTLQVKPKFGDRIVTWVVMVILRHVMPEFRNICKWLTVCEFVPFCVCNVNSYCAW